MFALTRIVEFHWVRCEGKRRDKYRRLIAKCFVGPYDIEAKMVSQGWALAYRYYSMDYVEEEAEAKNTSVDFGVVSLCRLGNGDKGNDQ